MKSTGTAGPWKFVRATEDEAIRYGPGDVHEAVVRKHGTKWRWSTYASGGWARTRKSAMDAADKALVKAGVELTK